MAKKRIYLDYASLTPIDPAVTRAMSLYSRPSYANPSSLYIEGVSAKNALTGFRKVIADSIHAQADEIIFTGSGTEANNLALQGVVMSAREAGIKKPHVIISSIEHSSIIETANVIEGYGCEVSRIKVDKNGVIDLLELKETIKNETVLISVMAVNNEVGSIQPIREIAHIVRKARKTKSGANSNNYPILHTDASQAFLYQELYVEKLGVDLMTLDGSKIYGPRGIGCLYLKRGTMIKPIIHGGGQENGFRSGTENLPAVAGLAKAIELADKHRGRETARLFKLRNRFISLLKSAVKTTVIHGDEGSISPHIVNVSIPEIDNEFMLFKLDVAGIACSTKSSCLRDEDESYVLRAMGVDSKTSLRFSFGRWTNDSDIVAAIKAIKANLAE